MRKFLLFLDGKPVPSFTLLAAALGVKADTLRKRFNYSKRDSLSFKVNNRTVSIIAYSPEEQAKRWL